jgi:hypothetical protein
MMQQLHNKNFPVEKLENKTMRPINDNKSDKAAIVNEDKIKNDDNSSQDQANSGQ